MALILGSISLVYFLCTGKILKFKRPGQFPSRDVVSSDTRADEDLEQMHKSLKESSERRRRIEEHLGLRPRFQESVAEQQRFLRRFVLDEDFDHEEHRWEREARQHERRRSEAAGRGSEEPLAGDEP
jgi:hypothetical protein